MSGKNNNLDEYNLVFNQLKKQRELVLQGGGAKKILQQHNKGKMTARERVAYLLDENKPSFEIGLFSSFGMYEAHGGCPASGVIVTVGYVSNRLVIVVANDATVKAGAWFPMTAKKNLRAQEIAMDNNLPIIYLVDSAGIYLPLQEDVFADKEHFGRIFRNNAVMSAQNIPQIAAIMGSCVAGGAYLPIMSDESLIVEETGTVFLAGSYLVKSAIGEVVDNETLGGAHTHSAISGVTDYKCKNDKECLDKIKNLVSLMGHKPVTGYDRVKPQKPKFDFKSLDKIFPYQESKPYDIIEIIDRIIDKDTFEEYKKEYGQTIVCGYARIEGWAVGIVANQRKIVKTAKNEMQMGGVIYNDSADKAARFIMNCNQKKIPLLFIHDVTGFMVGSRSEHSGIIKDGAKLVNVVANSVVPKFTLIIGNSYGAGNYAMCGKAFDPRLIIAWPTANIAVMSGNSAAQTLFQIQKASMKDVVNEQTIEDDNELLDKIKKNYQQKQSPYYAASQLWVDEIVLPEETRQVIALGIEMADQKGCIEPFKTGVLQT